MNFDTQFTRQKRSREFVTCAGDPIVIDYEYKIEDGVKSLVPVGSHNLQDSIQSFADSTDIVNIVQRFMNGEVEVLQQRKGMFGDFTHMPENYAQFYARLQECENAFYKLPLETREKFNNSPSEFWSAFGSPEFNALFEDKPVADVVDDVVKGASDNAE